MVNVKEEEYNMNSELSDWILGVLNDVDNLLIKNGLIGASDKMIDVKFETLLGLEGPCAPSSNVIDFNAYRSTRLVLNFCPNEEVLEIPN